MKTIAATALTRRGQQSPKRGRRAFWLTVAAFVWSLGLFFGGAVTLVGENGARVLAVLAIPAVLTTLAWYALNHKCSRGSQAAARSAWALIGVLLGFAVITGFSIGLFVLPIVGMLATAAALTPRGQ
jgi:hypothetical protein